MVQLLNYSKCGSDSRKNRGRPLEAFLPHEGVLPAPATSGSQRAAWWQSTAACAWKQALFLRQSVGRDAKAATDRKAAARFRNGFEGAAARVTNLVKPRHIC